jgi:hypothetical protein
MSYEIKEATQKPISAMFIDGTQTAVLKDAWRVGSVMSGVAVRVIVDVSTHPVY